MAFSPQHADLIDTALLSGDAGEIAAALGVAAQAYGIRKLSADTGIERTALYRSFIWGGNPRLEAMLKVAGVLGLELGVVRRSQPLQR